MCPRDHYVLPDYGGIYKIAIIKLQALRAVGGLFYYGIVILESLNSIFKTPSYDQQSTISNFNLHYFS